jgi:hypothetical protein
MQGAARVQLGPSTTRIRQLREHQFPRQPVARAASEAVLRCRTFGYCIGLRRISDENGD